jgi:hypothetical protein
MRDRIYMYRLSFSNTRWFLTPFALNVLSCLFLLFFLLFVQYFLNLWSLLILLSSKLKAGNMILSVWSFLLFARGVLSSQCRRNIYIYIYILFCCLFAACLLHVCVSRHILGLSYCGCSCCRCLFLHYKAAAEIYKYSLTVLCAFDAHLKDIKIWRCPSNTVETCHLCRAYRAAQKLLDTRWLTCCLVHHSLSSNKKPVTAKRAYFSVHLCETG